MRSCQPCHAPKKPHFDAVKQIVCYLIKTCGKGFILTPDGNLNVDCYVDADFAGLFGKDDPQDPACSQSRTGYVILLGGCPVFWLSKLKTEIAMSTMASEYIPLSTRLG
jgi:hypothetical protein